VWSEILLSQLAKNKNNPRKSRIRRYLDSLRFPVLLILMAIAFVADILLPDVIPFADEILLGLLVALLSRLKRKKPPVDEA